MDINPEISQAPEHFLDLALANGSITKSSECLHTGSVTGFDGYIVTPAVFPVL